MMRESEIDYSTLGWIRKELDETLLQAVDALKSFADDPDDRSQLQFCATHLAQVRGILQIVELEGAVMLTEEAEAVAQALLDDAEVATEVAADSLMGAVLQLRDYLARLGARQPDATLLVLPLVNELRAARGAALIAESTLFAPSLDAPGAQPRHERDGEDATAAVAREVRPDFQRGLVGYLRGQQTRASIGRMTRALDALDAAASDDRAGALWWIAAGLLDAVGAGELEDHSTAIRALIGRVERQIKQADGNADPLARALLYHVAQAAPVTPRVETIQETYGLADLAAETERLEHTREGLFGANRDAFRGVADAIVEDLAAVKDNLDLYLRGSGDAEQGLADSAQAMARIGDTLGVLGLAEPRRAIREQAEAILNVASADERDEDAAMAAAETLLYVETTLLDLVEGDGQAEETAATPRRATFEHEFQSVYGHALGEAIAEMGRIKETIVQFLETGESDYLDGVEQRFEAVRGALDLVELPRVSALIHSAASYAQRHLLVAAEDATPEALDDLAHTIASVEYYLEARRDGHPGSERVLTAAEESLQRLGSPVPDETSEAPVAADDEPEEAAPTAVLEEPEAEGTEPAAPAGAVKRRDRVDLDVPVMAEESDPEILEIFLEEAEEVLETLRETIPAWCKDPADEQALQTSRRMFHTLKGSGRLAGALLVGEFGWAFENLLNRVLEGALEPGAPLFAALDEALICLPALIAEHDDSGDDARRVMAKAAALADPELATPTVAEEEAQTEAEPAAMDPALYEIFSKETEDHLAAIERFLAAGRDAPGRAMEPLIRSLHTLTGSAHMAGVTPIARLGRGLDRLARSRFASGSSLGGGDQALALETVATVRAVVEALGQPGTLLPDVEALVEQLDERRGSATAPPSLEELTRLQADMEAPAAAMLAVASPEPLQTAMPGREPAQPLEPDEHLEVGKLTEPAPTAEPDDPEPADYAVALSEPTATAMPSPARPMVAEPVHRIAASAAEALPPVKPEPAVAVDDDLVAVFLEEADDILRFLEGTVEHWEEQPWDQDTRVAELHRSLHTLKGGARLAGFEGTGRLCHALEGVASEVAQQRVPADDAFFGALHDGFDRLTDMIEEARGGVSPEAPAGLIDRLKDLRKGGAEAAQSAGEADAAAVPDRELTEVFLEESADILQGCERMLHEWRQQPEADHYVTELQRALHTLKGGARMSGCQPMADLSHAVETLLRGVEAQDVACDAALFDGLETLNDRLLTLREAMAAERSLPNVDDMLALIERLRGGEGGAKPAAPTVRPVDTAAERREQSNVPGRREADAVRVRSDLLDELVNHAGEVSIYRSRLEQQAGSIGFNLAELGQTVTRLRDQLRNLEIETETQILYRYERENESRSEQEQEFDPLELDRFSQIQELSRALSESVSDLANIQGTLGNLNRESETLLLQQSRVNTELQDGLMRTRMVPFANLVPRMRRIVRQAAQELGKQAQLKVIGAQGEMDRSVLERVIPPLEHMLRNAVAHGIEPVEARRSAGKPEVGTISVSLDREGAEVVVRVADDGAGFNLEAIRRKAVDRGLMAADATLSDKEVMQFVLGSGFSTAAQVTQISGRGVGMDVVNAEIKQLGGSLDIDSRYGAGSRFTVRLPFTLALNQALLCQAGDEVYALPLSSIEGVVRLTHEELSELLADSESGSYEYAGFSYAVRRLGAMLGAGASQGLSASRHTPLILVQAGDHRLALQIDGLLGSRDIVVKSVGPQISAVPGVLGATILADGRVVLILDVGTLARLDRAGHEQPSLPVDAAATPTSARRYRPLIMVVDDSITMRKVATRLLERQDMDVVTAKDGVDAVAALQETTPDAMLLDIEMPRMDGYELATHMRNDEQLRAVPIVMITSRSGEKHRQRAREIGVDRYLGKPYQESELLATVQELLGREDASR